MRNPELVLALALAPAACAGAPSPTPPPSSTAPSAVTPVDVSAVPALSIVDGGTSVDARAAPDASSPKSAAGPSDPSQCDAVLANGKVGNEELRVCLSGLLNESFSPSIVTRDARRVDEALVPFDARLGPSHVKATFREITGDHLDDVVVEAPGGKDLDCRHVVSGAKIVDVLSGKALYRTRQSVGLSFAAAIAKGKHAGDPWAYAASVATPIPQPEACAIVQRAQKSFAAFQREATADVEIIDYPEPSLPFCLPKKTRRAATAKRLDGTQPIDCKSMECFDDASFCRNHEPDPSTDFYLFVKEGGRFKIRAVAYLRSRDGN